MSESPLLLCCRRCLRVLIVRRCPVLLVQRLTCSRVGVGRIVGKKGARLAQILAQTGCRVFVDAPTGENKAAANPRALETICSCPRVRPHTRKLSLLLITCPTSLITTSFPHICSFPSAVSDSGEGGYLACWRGSKYPQGGPIRAHVPMPLPSRNLAHIIVFLCTWAKGGERNCPSEHVRVSACRCSSYPEGTPWMLNRRAPRQSPQSPPPPAPQQRQPWPRPGRGWASGHSAIRG